MRLTAPFAKNQTENNLIHLKQGQPVGQWRDSEFGKRTTLTSKDEELTLARYRRRPHPLRRKHSSRPSSSPLHSLTRPGRYLQEQTTVESTSRPIRTNMGR